MKLTKWNLSSYETCSCGRERQVFLTSFYLTSFSFICLCGRTKLPVFPLSSKLVQKLACQLLNKSIGELSEQASKRKPETEVANKYNNTRVNAACSAVPDQVGQTVDWSFLLWLEQCKGGGRNTQILFFLKTWGPKNHFGTSKLRLMETNQRKSLISRSCLKRSRMWHRKVSTQY